MLQKQKRKTVSQLAADPFLLTLEGRDPHTTLLTTNQVAGLFQVDPSRLEEWRSKDRPPPFFDLNQLPGEELDTTKRPSIRYRLGNIRSFLDAWQAGLPWPAQSASSPLPVSGKSKSLSSSLKPKKFDLANYDLPSMKGGRKRKVPAHSTFASFLAEAYPADEWLFMRMGKLKRPVDFIQALDMTVSEDDTAEWMSLDDYADALQTSSRWMASADQSDRLEAIGETISAEADKKRRAAGETPVPKGRGRS